MQRLDRNELPCSKETWKPSVYELHSHQLTAQLTGLVSGIKRTVRKIYSYLFVDVLSGNDTFWALRHLK